MYRNHCRDHVTEVYGNTEKLSRIMTKWIGEDEHYIPDGLQREWERLKPALKEIKQARYDYSWYPVSYKREYKIAFGHRYERKNIKGPGPGFSIDELVSISNYLYEYQEFDNADIIVVDMERYLEHIIMLPASCEGYEFRYANAILNRHMCTNQDENGLTMVRLKKLLMNYHILDKSEAESMDLIRKAVLVHGCMAINDGFTIIKCGREGILRAVPVMPEEIPADNEEIIKDNVKANGYSLIPVSELPSGMPSWLADGLWIDTKDNRRMLEKEYGNAPQPDNGKNQPTSKMIGGKRKETWKAGWEEAIEAVNKLNGRLLNEGKLKEMKRSFSNRAYQKKLLSEYLNISTRQE